MLCLGGDREWFRDAYSSGKSLPWVHDEELPW